ncbi:MAG TPA: hypothetical protein VI636_01260 [Candidatus Angelobacter sp.]
MQPKNLVMSKTRMLLFSFFASFLVLAASLLIQWFVYDDWLHRAGPLRIVGTSIATVVTFAFMLRWQYAVREKQQGILRRLEMISYMNDRIRNALQAIECVTYLSQPEATASVRQAVDEIDGVLREVLADVGRLPAQSSIPSAKSQQKSA